MEKGSKKEWREEIEIAAGELITRVKELIKEGNIRRLIIKDDKGKTILEIPLHAGVAIGGIITLTAPLLAVLGAVAGVLAKVKIEIVREGNQED